MEYISAFQNHVALATITNQNVLIGYFSAGIPPASMKHIMSMDMILEKIKKWYTKAIHFQTQWERAEEISQWNCQPTKSTYHMFSSSSSTKPKDPNAMDIDVIRVFKLTPNERKRCIEKGLCFRCRKAGHLSTTCPTFPSKKVRRVQRKKEVEEIPLLKEIEDDKDEVVRCVSFTMDF